MTRTVFSVGARIGLGSVILALDLMIERLIHGTAAITLLKSHSLLNLESALALAFLLLAASSVTRKI